MSLEAPVHNEIATDIARGVARLLLDMGYSPLCELTLNTGRRVDVVGLDDAGRLVFVEIKSCIADFRADGKWPEYLDYCDEFYFAVLPDFPTEVLPGDVGLILADRYGGAIVRAATEAPAHASRRRAVLLRYARTAAARLRRDEQEIL
jgi:hypothetical protein